MSAPEKDGGAAFPTLRYTPAHSVQQMGRPESRVDCPAKLESVGGMTLRQYYKGEALKIIDSRYTNVGNEAACVHEIARYAGMLADAMLAEDAEHAKKQPGNIPYSPIL